MTSITAAPPKESDGVAPPEALRRPTLDLFLISLLILFLELACIRWFPAHVMFLTFFTNTVLLASFLGMSLGCLAANHPRNYLWATPFLLSLAMAAGLIADVARSELQKRVDVGHQATAQLVYFGAESLDKALGFQVPIELLAGTFFLLIALTMVGPGQQLGRALAAQPDRVVAYTVDICGSLTGILLFSLCSYFQLPPFFWFLPVAAGVAYFLWNSRTVDGQRESRQSPRTRVHFGVACATLLIILALGSWNTGAHHDENGRPDVVHYWSPYYRIDEQYQMFIDVNLLGHQAMRDREAKPSEEKPGQPHDGDPYTINYSLPYLFRRDAGGKPFKDVLVIGAGSGNDLSRALLFQADHIDAVEIDPVIQEIGRQHHPNKPYSDARVHPHNDDGRNFLRTADRQYDLVIFALVDSLVLHSGYSNLRLESYLFTKQCFDDVKKHLKPDGIFVMYNYYRQDWIVARLKQGLMESFGTEPLVWKVDNFTIILEGSEEAIAPIRKQFAEHTAFWVDKRRRPGPDSANGFAAPPAADESHFKPFVLANIPPEANLRTATDDWPFLYLHEPTIPLQPNLSGMAVMGGIAVVLILCFLPRATAASGRWSFDLGMFFLGAGFMLIETKAVVHMALLFGSTWMVNSVVFFAVLVMILLANLFVIKVRPNNLTPYFVGLLATLLLNAVVPLDFFLGWAFAVQVVAACSLVFAPILFAGVVFAVSFSRTPEADRAFGANIAGAMLGGLAENVSMILGFQYLVLVGVLFYLLAMVWQRRAPSVPSVAPTA